MPVAVRAVGITKNQVVNLERSSRYAALQRRVHSDPLARRDLDLEPVGALLKTGLERWSVLYGPSRSSHQRSEGDAPSPCTEDRGTEDPGELVERVRAALVPALRSGRLLDEAILGHGPVALLNEGFVPPARSVEDLLDRLAYLPAGASYMWMPSLLAALELGSLEAELVALFGGLDPFAKLIVCARRAPGRAPALACVVQDLPLAPASAWRLQRAAEQTILARLREEALPRVRSALVLAERLAASSADADGASRAERELRARLLVELRSRGMAASPRAAAEILLLRRLLASPNEDLTETLAWARANLPSSPSLDDLVAHSGFSKPVFLARFRETTGTSPMKWLSERKVEEAKRRLVEGNEALPQIARACGFRSRTAFRDTFRKHTGLSPKQYQQRHRRDPPDK